MGKAVAPPSAAGPAGADFEAKVGATYMLAMLRDAEPRGLPGMSFDRVELQRAAEGHPLDDIVVHAHDKQGAAVVLEVQVKRSISFAPNDKTFKEVVDQIAVAMQKPLFAAGRYEFAIATAQTTRVITGAYQEVLNWARKLGSAEVFVARIAREKSANDAMRTFVATLRQNLQAAGAPHDDDSVWQLLRHLQIHVYDFAAPGSVSENYARDRAADILYPEAKGFAGGLWSTLVAQTLELSSAGGDATRQSLIDRIQKDFRLAGDRRYPVIRSAIAEATGLALADIGDVIHGASLARLSHVTKIRAAADSGRFVEVRGDAGVGKSGLLKHVAAEVAREARVIVLAPGRIAKRGWMAMRREIGFDGTASELLSDLASDGGGWIFIDNLDFFDLEERTTVIDIVRAASAVPGVTVVATARRHFGIDEPSWLPDDAIKQLGRPEPVEIGQLNEEEIEQLREAQPRLRALLAKDHPARDVTSNLFRLSRLMSAPEHYPAPRSEVDMAQLWWQTGGGGAADHRLRARGRVLRDLATRSLKGEHIFDVTALDADGVDGVIRCESLRDFGNDRVAFRHDVLQEWAVANILIARPELVVELPMTMSASPTLARGVELAARFPLERSRDVPAWRKLLCGVSGAEAHPSWRRSVLLAAVHSELVGELMPLIRDVLIADDAALFRELIPIMMAVDVVPGRDLYAEIGVAPPAPIPDGFNVPIGAGWYYLVKSVLDLGDQLPPVALPEAVDLLVGWCHFSLLVPSAPLVDAILQKFKKWLDDIEQSNDTENWRDKRSAFDGAIDSKKLIRIEEDLRTTLVLLASRSPSVAKEYLQSVQKRRRKDEIYIRLLKFRGTLAQAAPDELSAITLDLLTNRESGRSGRHRHVYDIDDALTDADKRFIPASPAQGPFYDLLSNAPNIGLRLIRNLIDQGIAHHTKGKPPGIDDVLVVQLASGPRRFLWLNTYRWSRASHYYTITSALMALETWAHARIERGEEIETVLADVLGEPECPAAYLLVAVDVLLSHWPATRAAAVPYLASPELLSLDLSRPVQDSLGSGSFFGLADTFKEPGGPKLEGLKSRVSRGVSLDCLLSYYAIEKDLVALRDRTAALLRQSVERLGSPVPEDDLSNPRLMAMRATNMLDPANYSDVVAEDSDGRQVTGKVYVPPESERKHFEPLQKGMLERNNDLAATNRVATLVDHPKNSSPEAAQELAVWAQRDRGADVADHQAEESKDITDQAIVGAAMIAMRDGTTELRASCSAWAEQVFAKVMEAKTDPIPRMRSGMLFNPVALAFAGRVFALRDKTPGREDLKRLLDVAAADAAAARGAMPARAALRALDVRLPRAILRVGLAASVRLRSFNDSLEAEAQAAITERMASLQGSINAELAWLFDGASEPTWPEFPIEEVPTRERRFIRPGAHSDARVSPDCQVSNRYVDHQAAALWLSALWSRSDEEHVWVRDFERAYRQWTYAANGAGLAEDEEVAGSPSDWNEAFFAIVAYGMIGQTVETVVDAITPLFQLPDRQFFDVMSDYLRAADDVFFNDKGAIDPAVAVAVRARFAERLAMTRAWKRLRGAKSDGIELYLSSAVAVLFFNDYGFVRAPTCYLLKNAIEPSLVFIPLLQRMSVSAPCTFVALIVLNLVEIAPHLQQLPLVLGLAMSAVDEYPDDRSFWIDHGIGRRACQWLSTMQQSHPASFAANSSDRPAIDMLLAKLVAIGVVEARQLELALKNP